MTAWLNVVIAFGWMLEPPRVAAIQTMPKLVVTATRSERQPFDTPQAVSIISEEEIERLNQFATPDLFRYAEGVYVQRSNLGGGSPFIRGLTGKQVLLLIDGVRLNNSFYRFGPHQYLNTIDPNIIERIEVVRGPSSVLYGSDALGGTINIITKKRSDFSQPLAADGLLAGHYETAADAWVLRGQFEGNWNGLGAIGGATGKDYDDLNGGGDLGEQVPSAYEEVNVDLKLNYRFGDGHELVLAQQFTRQFDVPKTNEVVLGDRLQFNYEPQERILTYLDYRGREVGIFDALRLNLSYNGQQEGEQIIARATPSIETQELTDVGTFGAFFQVDDFVGARHHFTYGFEFYRDEYDTEKTQIDLTRAMSAAITPGVPDGTYYQNWALYAQDDVQLWKDAEAIAGIRYSNFESEGEVGATQLSFGTDAVVGNLNLRFGITPHLNLVGGLAWGFRAPNIEDFFGRVDFFNEIPNTELEPEEVFNKEIGLKYLSESLFAEAYYFHADYQGFIERVTVGLQPNSRPIQQRRNLRDALIQGVEAGLEYRWNEQWLLATNLMWTEGNDEDTDEPLRRIPPINGSVRLRYLPRTNLWVEAATVWADAQTRLAAGDITDPRIGPEGTSGYVVFDLRAGYQPVRDHELLLSLENILDKKYKTHGSGIFNPGINFGLTYRFRF
ncbi:MAG: TonB-dependent receptor plug domain-containing protein [Gammaproteobacteria bacterium]